MTRVAIMLLVILAACGGGGETPPSDSTGCDNSGVAGARVCTETKP